MKYLEKINSNHVTFIALVGQAYGHHQSKKKYRKSWVSFKSGVRTAAVYAVGTSKGKLRGRTVSVWKPGILPHDVIVSSKYKASMGVEAKGLSSLTVIWDDTCLRTHHDPTVEEWRLGEKRGEQKWWQVQSRKVKLRANKFLAAQQRLLRRASYDTNWF